MRPTMTWRMVALVLASLLTLGWRDAVGWWPLYILVALLVLDGALAWIGLWRLSHVSKLPPTQASKAAEPSDSTPLPADLKSRAKAVRERLRTDKLID
jgi:hypothetical protein